MDEDKRKLVEHVASLAKLHLEGKEKEKMVEHFEKILHYVEILNELDLEDVEPMSYPHPGTQRLREDVPERGKISREEVLEEAPDVYLRFFRVPSPLKGIIKKKG